jgi:hypothetical protein
MAGLNQLRLQGRQFMNQGNCARKAAMAEVDSMASSWRIKP